MGFKLRPGTSVFGNVTFTPGTNENYVAPPTHGSVNVALTATSTASTHIGDRPPSLAHDGIIGISDTDGSTISNLNAWVTTGEGVGAWMQLDWSTPQTVNKIKLYDRPNVTHDHIKGGTLTFSDGSSVTVGELPDGVVNGAPDPLEVTFDAKTITWVRFTVDSFTGHNAGLTEFEVWSVLAAPEPAPAPHVDPNTTHTLTLEGVTKDVYVGDDGWILYNSFSSDNTLTQADAPAWNGNNILMPDMSTYGYDAQYAPEYHDGTNVAGGGNDYTRPSESIMFWGTGSSNGSIIMTSWNGPSGATQVKVEWGYVDGFNSGHINVNNGPNITDQPLEESFDPTASDLMQIVESGVSIVYVKSIWFKV